MLVIKDVNGNQVPPDVYMYDKIDAVFNIRVLTKDGRKTWWAGDRGVGTFFDTLSIAASIPTMEPGYQVLCVQEVA